MLTRLYKHLGNDARIGDLTPTKAIDMPKVPKYEDVTIDVLTDEEVSRLLAAFDINTDAAGTGDYVPDAGKRSAP